MDVKGKVFLQLFNKRKLRNGTKTQWRGDLFSTEGGIKYKFHFSFKFAKHLYQL